MSLKLLPDQEKPRERLVHKGPDALSLSELIAVIIGSGTKGKNVLQLAQELLSQFHSLEGMAEASVEDLSQIKGMGKAKSIQLKAALALAMRLNTEEREVLEPVLTPHAAYRLIKPYFTHLKQEHFGMIMQNIRGGVIRCEILYKGTLTQTFAHPREIFQTALKYHAASVILVHNHPSGDSTPSQDDILLTKRLIDAGRLMGIPIHDHLIVSASGYYSFKERLTLQF